MPLTVRRSLLLALNLASTVLTLLTGLRENPVIVMATGRYDLIRARLITGAINFNIMDQDIVAASSLAHPKDVGESYRFITVPKRNPQTYASDRSTCMRVNTIKSTVLGVYFDDFWGKGVRRTQLFVYSISAQTCDVLNLTPQWYNGTCVAQHGGGNATLCGEYIFNHFDHLKANRTLQTLAEADYGRVGVPFLRCAGRPQRKFEYMTDLLLYSAYWAGGSDHVEIQSSRCAALPVVQDANEHYGLFQVAPMDQEARLVVGVDNTGWLVTIISVAYGIVSIFMICYGMLAALLRARRAAYVPQGVRFLGEWRFFKVLLPFMNIASKAPTTENRVVTFKGAAFLASDVWMNHWLYIVLSMMEALVTIRTTYIVFQTGSQNLVIQANLENFLFTASAVTKLTWLICLVHSLLRLGAKLGLQSIKQLKLIRPHVRHNLDWFIDASSMMVSYKVYSVLLCLYMLTLQRTRKSITLMKRQSPGKRGVYGGDSNIAQFWSSEIVCDLIVTVSIVLSIGVVLGSLIVLLTKYKYATRNRVMRMIQRRFLFVGWDAQVVLEALGVDPYNQDLIIDGACTTNCSLGAVLQQLYTSAPSGHVNLAGDSIFLENGFSKERPKLLYAAKKAAVMGLIDGPRNGGASVVSVKYTQNPTELYATEKSVRESPTIQSAPDDRRGSATGSLRVTKSLFDKKLQLATDGVFGKILLVDVDDPGRMVKSASSATTEFEVFDALAGLSIMDIKPLLGNDRKLRIR